MAEDMLDVLRFKKMMNPRNLNVFNKWNSVVELFISFLGFEHV